MSPQDMVMSRGRLAPDRWFGLAVCSPKLAFSCRRELKISENSFRDPMHKKLYKVMIDRYVVTAPELKLTEIYGLMVKNKIEISISDLCEWAAQAFDRLPLPWGKYCDWPRQPMSQGHLDLIAMVEQSLERSLIRSEERKAEEKAFADRMASEVEAQEPPAPEPVTYDNLPL